MKYAVLCINEERKCCSLKIYDTFDEANSEMKADVNRECQQAKNDGFDLCYNVGKWSAEMEAGDEYSYVWEIRPVNC